MTFHNDITVIRLVFVVLTLSLTSCKKSSSLADLHPVDDKTYEILKGSTMGTYYRITTNCINQDNLQSSIDSLLIDINSVVSTYEPQSYISIINKSESDVIFKNFPKHFDVNLRSAQYWYNESNGYLDVSIMPLVNYWGFGYHEKKAITHVDSAYVDSIYQLVRLDKWQISESTVSKYSKGQQIDFSALAKGYAVDKVGELLGAKGCTDYLIDIGGEYIARGLNASGSLWTIGISTPSADAEITDVALVIQLDNQALASSGNYRNYHEVDGRKYGHTLNPKTGYPYQDELLGVSIITEQCIDADAIATACMAMGYRKAVTFIDSLQNVTACFLVGDEDGTIKTKFSNGFIRSVLQ